MQAVSLRLGGDEGRGLAVGGNRSLGTFCFADAPTSQVSEEGECIQHVAISFLYLSLSRCC